MPLTQLTQNPQTGQSHTAKWAVIFGGFLGLLITAGVIFGKLPYEALSIWLPTLIGLFAMAMRSKNGG